MQLKTTLHIYNSQKGFFLYKPKDAESWSDEET